ncbi:MAG: lamin tail domain-containing protein [Candidatus Omnitrophica bacterium]|nr:lamin tail domain-containing protein [Candidatus Omnitrophota bacterium]
MRRICFAQILRSAIRGALFASAASAYLAMPIMAGNTGQIEVKPVSLLDYGRTNLSNPLPPINKDVDITNIGTTNVTIQSAEIVSGDTTRFRLRSPFSSTVLIPNGTEDVDIEFAPGPTTPNGVYEAVLRITTDLVSPNDVIDITLRGEVVLSTPGLPGSVVINEFSYDPSTGGVVRDYNNDGGASDEEDEFVEIFNVTNQAVDISGWSIDDKGRPSEDAFVFPANTILPAKGFAIVFNGGTPTGFKVPAFTGLPRLGNGGDRIFLEDGFGDIDSVGYEDDATGTMNNLAGEADGGSFARELDGATAFVVREPADVTPGRTNDLEAGMDGLPGDLDEDGDVQPDDLLALLEALSTGDTVGDVNQDGENDGLDLFLAGSNWMVSEQ